MTARLQAASSSDHPVLLRTSSNAGHGIGTAVDEQIEEGADVYGFPVRSVRGSLYPGEKVTVESAKGNLINVRRLPSQDWELKAACL